MTLDVALGSERLDKRTNRKRYFIFIHDVFLCKKNALE